MYRPRLLGCAVLAVLAVLMGGTSPAVSGPTAAPGAASRHPASALPGGAPRAASAAGPGVRGAADPGGGAAPAAAPRPPDGPHVDPAALDGGPSCAPGPPGRGGTPGVPVRAGGDQAHVPPGRPVPPVARPQGSAPRPVTVRGPDRPAPGPVELSVMRV